MPAIQTPTPDYSKVARYGPDVHGRIVMLPPEPVAEPSPELPEDAVADLVAILADPKAAKQRLDELADRTAKARAAIAEAKRAKSDRERLDVELATVRKAHDEKLANELAAHTVAMTQRERNLEGREQDLARREKAAADLLEKLKADRADLKRRLEQIRQAAAE